MKKSVVVNSASNHCHEWYFTYVACQALPVYAGFCLRHLSVFLPLRTISKFQREPVQFSNFLKNKHRRRVSWLILGHLRTWIGFPIQFSDVEVSIGSQFENWTENQFEKQVRVREPPNYGKNRILFLLYLLKRSWIEGLRLYNCILQHIPKYAHKCFSKAFLHVPPMVFPVTFLMFITMLIPNKSKSFKFWKI